MVGLTILIILALVMGITKGFMNASGDNKFGKKYDHFNKAQSWKQKWKLNSVEIPIKPEKNDNWWYFGIMKPNFKEKFPFSSTILVSFTDFWHLMQYIHYKAILGTIYILTTMHVPYYKMLVLHTLFLVTFEYVFRKVKKARD